ncbi:hypothetical protein TI39_contig5855g00004 [Zymoseptoria brevis]|uniref:Suppressor of anucleate metulae protein B n=1 Tax=Zymoseptoria brevis TaxID=1047168 RepID=A0A0F4G523_9PEZI|nr:hypothetical protein TI39_contig5855g00004 [Zymoseptoria brevis]
MPTALGPCVNCAEAARIKCAHCDDGVSFTAYCGTKCLKKHQAKHQVVCNEEKKLQSAKALVPSEQATKAIVSSEEHANDDGDGCTACGKAETTLTCLRCTDGIVHYCNEDCHDAFIKKHKLVCTAQMERKQAVGEGGHPILDNPAWDGVFGNVIFG